MLHLNIILYLKFGLTECESGRIWEGNKDLIVWPAFSCPRGQLTNGQVMEWFTTGIVEVGESSVTAEPTRYILILQVSQYLETVVLITYFTWVTIGNEHLGTLVYFLLFLNNYCG